MILRLAQDDSANDIVQTRSWPAIAPVGIELRVVTLLGWTERALHPRIVVEQGKEYIGLAQTFGL